MDLRLTFNEDVLNYDKMRPTYVKDLYDDVIQFSNLDINKRVLEIGIGTGQATLPFLNSGCKVTAVELGKDLAEFSKEKFSKYNNFEIINNDFESVDLRNSPFDLIRDRISLDTTRNRVYKSISAFEKRWSVGTVLESPIPTRR
jgi:tRNA A58 N-methylase Trm61